MSGWSAAVLGRSRSAATQANQKVISFRALLFIDIPLLHVEGVADVEELFLSVEFQFAKRFRQRLRRKLVELWAVDANDVSKVALPSRNLTNWNRFGGWTATGTPSYRNETLRSDSPCWTILTVPMALHRMVQFFASYGVRKYATAESGDNRLGSRCTTKRISGRGIQQCLM